MTAAGREVTDGGLDEVRPRADGKVLGGGPDHVLARRGRAEVDRVSRLTEAVRDVELLEVEEVPLVEPAHATERVAPHEHARPFGVPDGPLLLEVDRVPSRADDTPDGAGQERTNFRGQRRVAARGERGAAMLEHAWCHERADGMGVEVSREVLDLGGVDHRVGVEEEDLAASGERRDSRVAPGTETSVDMRLHDGHGGCMWMSSHGGDGVVEGGVVDDDHGAQTTDRESVERGTDRRRRAIGDDHDADVGESVAVAHPPIITGRREAGARIGRVTAPLVALFAGSRWDTLERQPTRWGEVARLWATQPDRCRVVVVDWPGFAPRAAVRRVLARTESSWLPGTRLVRADIPLPSTRTPLDDLAWKRVADHVCRAIGEPIDVALSANPLWNRALRHVDASRGFDAVDDWRANESLEHLRARVDDGYSATRAFATASANARALARTLAREHGLAPTVIENGVDVDRFARAEASRFEHLGDPFAVYVGVVEHRVDLALLEEVARSSGVRTVVAGPVSVTDRTRLEGAGARVLGPVDRDAVPSLLAAARVALLPHRLNTFTASMDPMKLREYLASGLRVVATDVVDPGLSERVTVATGPEFAEAVAQASTLPRDRTPDPWASARPWAAVADELFALHVGGPR